MPQQRDDNEVTRPEGLPDGYAHLDTGVVGKVLWMPTESREGILAGTLHDATGLAVRLEVDGALIPEDR